MAFAQIFRRRLFSSSMLVIAVVTFSAPVLAAPEQKIEGALDMKINGITISGVPIEIELTVTNTGNEPFSYWCGGPAHYPPGDSFSAVIVDEQKHERKLSLSNGQYVQGSGNGVKIASRERVVFPAVMDPLPPGKYTLKLISCDGSGYIDPFSKERVLTWPAMKTTAAKEFEVKTDAPAKVAYEVRLLRRVREDEAFAAHVAATYPGKAVLDALLADLASNDEKVAYRAAETLFDLREFPPGWGAVFKRTMAKHLVANPIPRDTVSMLAALAEREGSDDSLDAALAFVEAGRHWINARYNLQNLSGFKQPRAQEGLRRELENPDLGVRFTAAAMLCHHHDPAAVPVLIAASKVVGSGDRNHAFYRLSDFWNDARAVAAIEEGTRDSDPRVRDEANDALRIVKDREGLKAPSGKPATPTTTQPTEKSDRK